MKDDSPSINTLALNCVYVTETSSKMESTLSQNGLPFFNEKKKRKKERSAKF